MGNGSILAIPPFPVTPVFPAPVSPGQVVSSTTYGNVVRQALIDLWTNVQHVGTSAGAVGSVFGREGDIVAQAGDYTVGQVTGAVPDSRQIIAGSGLTGGGALTGDLTLTVAPDSTLQRVQILNAGALVGSPRPRINFLAGANVTLDVAEDAAQNRVDVEISSSGGGGGGGTPGIPLQVNGDVIGNASSGSAPIQIGHTWALLGDVTAITALPPMFVSLNAGQTSQVTGLRMKLASGTSVGVQLKHNGANVGGVITVTTTAATTPLSVAVASGDELSLVLSSPVGAPTNLSATLILEHTT